MSNSGSVSPKTPSSWRIWCGRCILPFLCVIVLASCRSSNVSEGHFRKIKKGMNLAQVESILGPGEAITSDQAPQVAVGPARMAPVVSGDEIFRWEDAHTAACIVLGFSNGRVSDTWYWEPSL